MENHIAYAEDLLLNQNESVDITKKHLISQGVSEEMTLTITNDIIKKRKNNKKAGLRYLLIGLLACVLGCFMIIGDDDGWLDVDYIDFLKYGVSAIFGGILGIIAGIIKIVKKNSDTAVGVIDFIRDKI